MGVRVINASPSADAATPASGGGPARPERSTAAFFPRAADARRTMGDPRGVDGRVVVGLVLLLLGIAMSVAAFQRAAAAPVYSGAPEPGRWSGLVGGVVATAGLGLLAWWSIGAMARYEVREARGEIAAAVAEGQATAACAGCGARNPRGQNHCGACGARLA